VVGIAPESEGRIRSLKGREEKSFLQLIGSADWLPRFTAASLPVSLGSFWPGAVTIILPTKAGTGALRVPDDPLLQRLLERLDRPLFSSSVNRSGQPPLWRIGDILREFEERVDFVVDAGDLPARLPSTILDATSRPCRVLRQGAVRIPGELL